MHGVGAPSCSTTTFLPATATLPLRASPELALIARRTVPFPDELLPLVMEIHESSVFATHAHPESVVTSTLASVPAALAVIFAGDTV